MELLFFLLLVASLLFRRIFMTSYMTLSRASPFLISLSLSHLFLFFFLFIFLFISLSPSLPCFLFFLSFYIYLLIKQLVCAIKETENLSISNWNLSLYSVALIYFLLHIPFNLSMTQIYFQYLYSQDQTTTTRTLFISSEIILVANVFYNQRCLLVCQSIIQWRKCDFLGCYLKYNGCC